MRLKEVQLPSGAILKILKTPFAESKLLYQAVLEEVKGIPISQSSEISDLMKTLICTGFASKKIETALNICLKRCTYNDLKIDDSTFEPIEARADYTMVWIEVIEDNITPFMSGLSVGLKKLSSLMESAQTPRP